MIINKNPTVRLFKYTGTVKRGSKIKKVIAAKNREEAIKIVKDRDQVLEKIRDITPIVIMNEKVPEFELINFLRDFGDYIESQFTPTIILNLFMNKQYSYQTKVFFSKLYESFRQGMPAHVAFKQTGVVDKQVEKIIQTGEKTGKLVEALREIADLIEMRAKMKKELKISMIRPVFTMLFAIGIVAFVIPAMVEPIKGVFASVGKGEIPALTKVVLGVTGYVKANGVVMLYGNLLLILSVVWLYTTNLKAKLIMDKMILRMPVIGPFVQSGYVYMFFVSLNMFVQSGFSPANALKEIAASISNSAMKEDIIAVNIESKNGLSLSKAIQQSIYIPDVHKEIFASSEKKGDLKDTLEDTIKKVHKEYEAESKKVILKVTTFISVLVAALVAVVVFSVYMPMFSLIGSINQSLTE